MTWRWIDEVFLALLGYPVDGFKENSVTTISANHPSSSFLSSPHSSHWSNISSILTRKPVEPLKSSFSLAGSNEQQQQQHHHVETTNRGTFYGVIQEEKLHLSRVSTNDTRLSGHDLSNEGKSSNVSPSHLSSYIAAHLTLNDHVYSLSFSEVEWFKCVMRLSERVNHVHSWIRKVFELRRSNWFREDNADDTNTSGLYMFALADALDEEMGYYRKRLMDMELEFRKDTALSPRFLQPLVDEYRILFNEWSETIDRISKFKFKGAQIMELIHEHLYTGLPKIKETYSRILNVLHRVFYRQLTAWLVYGQLQDPYGEFMIFKVVEKHSPEEDLSESKYIYDTSIGLISGGFRDDIVYKEIERKDSSSSIVSLDLQRVPSYISSQTAQLVWFIGRTVANFRSSSHERSSSHPIEKIEMSLNEILSSLTQSQDFNAIKFGQAMIQANETIAAILLQVIVNEANLSDHLHLMRHIYLLGSGIFSVEFISFINECFLTSFERHMTREIQGNFRKILTTILPEDTERLLQRFSLKLLTIDDVSSDPCPKKGWEVRLHLNYAVDWPLNLLITPSIIERYNRIFRFVLAVRRVQLTLHQTWKKQQQLYKSLTMYQDPLWIEMCHLRHQMIFFIDLLQVYVQDEVIETQQVNLIRTIETSHDFDQLYRALDHHVNTMFSYCFLHMSSIHQSFYDIFDAIMGFCRYIEQVPSRLSRIFPDTLEFTRFQETFQRNVSLIFQKFTHVQSSLSNPHLAHFLLRLDFNHHYDTEPSSSS